MAWSEEDKKKVIEMYQAGEPTPASSTELINDIAQEMEQSPNAVRQVLVQAKVYVKKEADAGTKGTATKTTGDKTPRVSKESQIADLRAAIEAKGVEADDDILSKLTGKAAVYFLKVLG